jgi:hypothetical protein
MTDGCDYSFARPDPVCLFNDGIKFAVRYTSIGSSGKNMTPAEVQRLLQAKIALVTVFEESAGHILGGRAAGVDAAKASRDLAGNCGMPRGRPHYFALDIDPNPLTNHDWDQIKGYLDGTASVLGWSSVGIYGGFRAIEKLVPDSAMWGWQTYAWSGGRWSDKAHLQQFKNGVQRCGGVIDLDRTHPDRNITDYGQWGLGDALSPDLGGFSMADVDVILDKLEVMRVGDASGVFNAHDFASLEGVAKKVDAARDDIEWLKKAVKVIATATHATLPPEA